MRILVTGGTGLVGSQVVAQLAGGAHDVQVLTRDPAKARNLPAGVTAVEGNLQDPATVRRVFNGVDAVFLLNAVSQTEANESLMAISGIRRAGVERLVYLSVHHVDGAPWLPHFGSKIAAEAAIQKSGVSYTILRPNNFYQNDYMVRDALMQYGVYPVPLGDAGLSRVDVRDIAEAAVAALTSAGHEGQTYDLVGPDVLTGQTVTDAWSRALGKPIAYGGDDLDAWEAQSLRFMPDWLVYDLRLMFAYFQTNGLIASPEALERQTRLLGHAPRTFDAFAAETAAAWNRAR